MSHALLINPSHRPSRRKTRKAASPAQKRARAAFAAAARARRKNPARRRRVAVRATPVAHRRRRRNPIHALARHHTSRRRRRNPIGGLGLSTTSIIAQLKAALMGGAGAVAMDIVMGQANKYLPASLQSNPNSVGVGDGVKALLTVVLGQVLRKPTKGASVRMAQGALAVQAADILRGYVPSSMTMGYYSPGRVLRGPSPRVGPNMAQIAPQGVAHMPMARYLAPGNTQLLSRYMAPGNTQLLNANGARSNSNVRIR